MSNLPDPDFSAFAALPEASAPTGAQKVEEAAAGVKSAVTKMSETNKGTPVGDAATAASEIATAGRAMADNVALAEQAAKDLKAAEAAWKKAAAGAMKADLDAADKALEDAKKVLADAAKAEDDARDRVNSVKPGEVTVNNYAYELSEACAATNKAEEDLRKARDHATALHKQNKDAREALRAALQRIADTLRRVKGSTPSDKEQDGGTGVGMPGDGTGTGRPSGEVGTRSGPAGTAKPSGTPSAARPSGTPTEAPSTSTSSTNGLTPAETAALITTAKGQQNQQQPQTQQAAAQMPTMPQVPQQTNQQQNKRTASEKPEGDKLVEAALGSSPSAILAGLGGGSPSVTSVTSASPSPGSSEHGTQLRAAGTPITGTSLGGSPAVNTQNPVTSGQSATGLTTPSDTSGRPQGSERTAYSPTPAGAETKTSGASGTGTGTGQNAHQQAGGRPVGSGMPMMPMTPMTGGAPAAPASRQGDGEQSRGVASTSDPLGLMHERGDAVEGGTIAQNRDKPAA
ncbi:hypothetical protein A5666_00035 [Mycolicibacterium fortuitum]|uniref:hypothetical protein n=1 Tax=Mycolicibacterium fortuitum TaxID=1766 RepID=UPI0007E99E14|nr:hypothetical protein [Mycolicibacterium fortuitum]OBA92967.1 hypothetical protein A5665_10675 [Mycolicibacterium fortuitum]OBI66916.1 hypothetical protein A5666_00035 [Mycolicibacterium fortuitum]